MKSEVAMATSKMIHTLLTYQPLSQLFATDRPTHHRETEGDGGKRNILCGWSPGRWELPSTEDGRDAVIGNFKNNLHWGVPWIFRNITVTQGWLLREDNLTGQRHDKLKANNCNREQLFRPCWTSSAPWQDPGDGLTFHYIAWDC